MYRFLLLIMFAVSSCEYENLQLTSVNEISYIKDIKPILSTKCSVIGCHVPGSTIGDFFIYSEIKSRIDNGKFDLMVFNLKIMPPTSSAQLSQEEFTMLKTWVDEGARLN